MSAVSELCTSITLQLKRHDYECMICCDRIRDKAQTWSCQRCWILFHLACLQKWAKESLDPNTDKWRCPGCRVSIPKRAFPKQYRCFCQKSVNPVSTPSHLPHSCGNPCGKRRKCPHKCSQPCHPGPCAPCPLPGPTIRCFCGKQSMPSFCGQEQSSCGNICRKLQDCKVHTCRLHCHKGKCPPCPKEETQKCFCGKSEEERQCGSGAWDAATRKRHFSCQSICNRELSCSYHNCESMCHQGKCPSCPRTPSSRYGTECACGKKFLPVMRSDCTQSYPSCGQKCEKPLLCQLHTCSEICHDSPCRPCALTCSRPCLCGRAKLKVSCQEAQSSAPQCRKVCKSILSCGIHKCGQVCCPGIDHICRKTCEKMLHCGQHQCDEICHLGECPDCPRLLRNGISCTCGNARIPGPIPCGANPPNCTKPCSRERECGHPCLYLCHIEECPPCTKLVSKQCAGGHLMLKNIPCHALAPGCGRSCEKTTSCGTHKCSRKCHSGACSEVCQELCLRKRIDCEHFCQLKCHALSSCPDVTCRQLVSLECPCGRRKEHIPCAQSSTVQMICDSKCHVEKRSRDLRKAFELGDKIHAHKYSDWDLEQAKEHPSFVLKLESTIEAFLLSDENTLYLPHMGSEKRQLVHQVAFHYKINSEVFDDTNRRRFVRLAKSLDSSLPAVLLSDAITMGNHADVEKDVLFVHEGPNKAAGVLLGRLHDIEGQFRVLTYQDGVYKLGFRTALALKRAKDLLESHPNLSIVEMS